MRVEFANSVIKPTALYCTLQEMLQPTVDLLTYSWSERQRANQQMAFSQRTSGCCAQHCRSTTEPALNTGAIAQQTHNSDFGFKSLCRAFHSAHCGDARNKRSISANATISDISKRLKPYQLYQQSLPLT